MNLSSKRVHNGRLYNVTIEHWLDEEGNWMVQCYPLLKSC